MVCWFSNHPEKIVYAKVEFSSKIGARDSNETMNIQQVTNR